jgi:Skp family chaperone for outer membrane proteins
MNIYGHLEDAFDQKKGPARVKARNIIQTYETLRMIGFSYCIFPGLEREKIFDNALNSFYSRDYKKVKKLIPEIKAYEQKLEELEIEDIQSQELEEMKKEFEMSNQSPFWRILQAF